MSFAMKQGRSFFQQASFFRSLLLELLLYRLLQGFDSSVQITENHPTGIALLFNMLSFYLLFAYSHRLSCPSIPS